MVCRHGMSRRLDVMCREEELLVMIQEVDPDGDGKISWNEFLQIMKKVDDTLCLLPTMIVMVVMTVLLWL